MSCDDIKKRLQPFLDDLLVEDEYEAFCDHIQSCDKCGEYARSIGSLSNQLWKLGKVGVPEDLGSTIMYKLAHPEEKAQPSEFVISKKHMVIGTILILSAGVIFFGIGYFRNKPYMDEKGAPIIKTEVIRTSEPPSDSEAQSLLNRLETIATRLGTPEKENTMGLEAEKENMAKEVSPSTKEPLSNKEPGFSKTRPLHWHFRYAEKVETSGLKQEIQKVALRLQQELEKKELLEDGIKRLKKEMVPSEPLPSYPESMQKTLSQQRAQKDSELQKSLEQIKEQEQALKRLEEERRGWELRLTQGAEEKRQKETRRKTKLSDVLNALSITPDYQKHDILVFSATGEKVERALEQILFISEDKNDFRNFTTDIMTLPDKESRVSIYLEHNETSVLHWHIDPFLPSKKSHIRDILRELSSSIDYESEELLICSIPDAELEKLQNRIQATGVSLTEYGSVKSQEGVLSSGPITVSIYFTK